MKCQMSVNWSTLIGTESRLFKLRHNAYYNYNNSIEAAKTVSQINKYDLATCAGIGTFAFIARKLPPLLLFSSLQLASCMYFAYRFNYSKRRIDTLTTSRVEWYDLYYKGDELLYSLISDQPISKFEEELVELEKTEAELKSKLPDFLNKNYTNLEYMDNFYWDDCSRVKEMAIYLNNTRKNAS